MSGTAWLVEEFGRGGIARYTADVARLLADGGLPACIATTTGGPAPGTGLEHRVWFPRRGPGPIQKVTAALGGVSAALRSPSEGDVVWVPLGVRPGFEAALVRSATASGARVVATIHNRRPHDRERGERRVLTTAARCDVVVVHTAAMAAWGRSGGLRPVRLPFPPPQEATGPASRITRSGLGVHDDERIIVLAGTLRPYKGVDVLLDALAATGPDGPTVVLAGQVPDRPALDRRVADLGLERQVRIVAGYLDGGELLDILDLADVIALPYLAIDHSGIGALAASRGLPAVGSDLAGVRELFGEAGRYARPGDSTSLARLLKELPNELAAMRAAARERPSQRDLSAAYCSIVTPMLG